MGPLFKNIKIHRSIYFFGLALVVASLPLSKYMETVGLLILSLNWLLEGNYKQKIGRFFSSRIAVIICSLFVLHVIGLIYTTDFDYGFFDLRTKIPLLILPFIIASSEPVPTKIFRGVLLIFVMATLASTLISTYVYLFEEISDIRDIIVCISSHIRLSLMISLAFFISLHFAFSWKKLSLHYRFIFIVLAAWFVFFLVILESITGLSITVIVAFVLLIRMAFNSKKIWIKALTVVGTIALPLLLFFYIRDIYKDIITVPVDNEITLDLYTSQGNPYSHDTTDIELENGHYVWRYICESEMREVWNKRSELNYDGTDRKGQELKSTLRRFLTSRGYRKDAVGVNKLTNEEIAAIENGISIYQCMGRQTVRERIFETLWEYENFKMTGNPNEKSLVMRIEYWKTSLGIIKDNFLIGVGTGDMNIAFADQYEKTNSRLEKKWRVRSHNQFLSIATGFGLIGLAWFLLVLLYPFAYKYIRRDFVYFVFFMILMISMFTEDTIESQEGIYFYTFFVSFLLLSRAHSNESYETDRPDVS